MTKFDDYWYEIMENLVVFYNQLLDDTLKEFVSEIVDFALEDFHEGRYPYCDRIIQPSKLFIEKYFVKNESQLRSSYSCILAKERPFAISLTYLNEDDIVRLQNGIYNEFISPCIVQAVIHIERNKDLIESFEGEGVDDYDWDSYKIFKKQTEEVVTKFWNYIIDLHGILGTGLDNWVDIISKKSAATRLIMEGCHNWLYKPVCKDGTIGIVPRLQMKKCCVKDMPEQNE
jgi:hypothetical protein